MSPYGDMLEVQIYPYRVQLDRKFLRRLSPVRSVMPVIPVMPVSPVIPVMPVIPVIPVCVAAAGRKTVSRQPVRYGRRRGNGISPPVRHGRRRKNGISPSRASRPTAEQMHRASELRPPAEKRHLPPVRRGRRRKNSISHFVRHGRRRGKWHPESRESPESRKSKHNQRSAWYSCSFSASGRAERPNTIKHAVNT